jgi:hypothetical protein
METAKVDIRKLQTLNDCINRTIEALNQVRLTVHGVQSIGTPSYLGAYPGAFASPFAIAPQLVGQIPGQVPGLIPGIAHSAQSPFAQAFTNPWNNVAQLQAAAQWPNVAQTLAAANQAAAFGANPLSLQNLSLQNGLGHTGVGLNQWGDYADPYTTARIAQTFPFVHWGYSPFGWPSV